MKTFIFLLLFGSIFFASCGNKGPEPINYNKDACEFCKMSISESHFAAELITVKGRVYKFDDLQCLLQYDASNKEVAVKNYYVADFLADKQLIDAAKAFFIKSETLRSPMGGNIAGFSTQESLTAYADKNQGKIMSWEDLTKNTQIEVKEHNGQQHH